MHQLIAGNNQKHSQCTKGWRQHPRHRHSLQKRLSNCRRSCKSRPMYTGCRSCNRSHHHCRHQTIPWVPCLRRPPWNWRCLQGEKGGIFSWHFLGPWPHRLSAEPQELWGHGQHQSCRHIPFRISCKCSEALALAWACRRGSCLHLKKSIKGNNDLGEQKMMVSESQLRQQA